MITPGQWQLAGPEHGEPMTQDHPGEPDHSAYIYVTRGEHEVVIATVEQPTYWASGDAYGRDDSVEIEAGDWEENGKLLTSSPTLLRFVQSLAYYQDVPPREVRERALALIEQLNAVEVTNAADRW